MSSDFGGRGELYSAHHKRALRACGVVRGCLAWSPRRIQARGARLRVGLQNRRADAEVVPHESSPYRCTLERCKWEHLWFERDVLPKAIERFRSEPKVQTIVFLEDDAAPKPGAKFSELLTHVAKVAPSALWAGYNLRAGEARYGSHCVAVTRASAE